MTAAPPPALAVDRVGMVFDGSDGQNRVLEDISLEIRQHDLIAIVGESGCGKTTLLRIMSGLQKPTTGAVWLDGAPLTQAGPQVCLVFQHYVSTLLPWRRSIDNVLLGLKADGMDGQRLRESAYALLERMGVANAASRYPWELSGGMQQRIVLARALVRKPRLLLLDEPLSALDELTRAELQDLLRAVHRTEACAIVLVSHNLEEVVQLSRTVVILGGHPARIQSIVTSPEQLSRETLRSRLAGGPRALS